MCTKVERLEQQSQGRTKESSVPAYGSASAPAPVIGVTVWGADAGGEPETLVQLSTVLRRCSGTMLTPPTALTRPPRRLLLSTRLIAAEPSGRNRSRSPIHSHSRSNWCRCCTLQVQRRVAVGGDSLGEVRTCPPEELPERQHAVSRSNRRLAAVLINATALAAYRHRTLKPISGQERRVRLGYDRLERVRSVAVLVKLPDVGGLFTVTQAPFVPLTKP